MVVVEEGKLIVLVVGVVVVGEWAHRSLSPSTRSWLLDLWWWLGGSHETAFPYLVLTWRRLEHDVRRGLLIVCLIGDNDDGDDDDDDNGFTPTCADNCCCCCCC